MSTPAVRALTFDVFGTVVDWRSSVVRECRQFGEKHGIDADWEQFVDAWRYEGYMGGIGQVIRGELPFMTTDQLHRRKLDSLLAGLGVSGLGEAEIDHLNRAWHRLDPWPDSVNGLARLRSRFTVSTLSNGNVALLVNMAKHAGLTWDCVLCAELTGAFKPQPECYLNAANFLGLDPGEVMLVAAHKNDLKAAQKAGFQAAYIPRPAEAGPSRNVDLTFDAAFQYNANSFEELADQLGCP